jgi:hypothetical protein
MKGDDAGIWLDNTAIFNETYRPDSPKQITPANVQLSSA